LARRKEEAAGAARKLREEAAGAARGDVPRLEPRNEEKRGQYTYLCSFVSLNLDSFFNYNFSPEKAVKVITSSLAAPAALFFSCKGTLEQKKRWRSHKIKRSKAEPWNEDENLLSQVKSCRQDRFKGVGPRRGPPYYSCPVFYILA